jgi:ubiquinone/menaquinone biosynthesis C-methylase UbiE
MQCTNHIEHYRVDAELFDYFEEPTGANKDFTHRLQQQVLHRCSAHGIKPNERVLDIGSGSGWIAQHLTQKGALVTSIDLSHKNLARLLIETTEKASFGLADVYRLPFRDGSFHVVVASEVLEHLNTPADAVREMRRVLASGGRIVISTPYKEKIQYYLCIHCNKRTPANAHLQSFDKQKLLTLFHSAQLNNVRFYTIGNKVFIYSRLSYLLRFLPFAMWKTIDGLCNLILDKPSHIAAIISL